MSVAYIATDRLGDLAGFHANRDGHYEGRTVEWIVGRNSRRTLSRPETNLIPFHSTVFL